MLLRRAAPAGNASTLPSPLGSLLVALPAVTQQTAAEAAAVPRLEAVPTSTGSGATWSSVAKSRGVIAGGIAALLALAGLGIAGAARSSAFAGVCTELARFPFPRFRVLPCPGFGARTETLGNGAAPASAGNRSTPTDRTPPAGRGNTPGGGSLPPLPVLPRVGGVLGAAVTKAPGSFIKGIVVAVLAVANALLLGIRWRVGRIFAR